MSPMMRLAEAARAIGAQVCGEDAAFASVSTDTRTLDAGALFVALRGERFDGHAFLAQARAAGAAAALVARDAAGLDKAGLPLLAATDTRAALGALARAWRGRFALPLVAVAGSNGKTTVKEMIAAVLRRHFGEGHALATEGNLNNEVGLPLTLLRLAAGQRAAVVEIGMNHPGETARLAAIAAPTIGLVNNAQREHQEFMENTEAVAREHAALIEALPPGGVAVLNADDPFAPLWREAARRSGARVRDFGIENPAAVGARLRPAGHGSEIAIAAPEGEARFALALPGLHHARNAAAAAAAATAAGASLRSVAEALGGFAGVAGRSQRCIAAGGAALIDDTYNANPDSVRAAIEVLAGCHGPTVLVLGDMGEVGRRGPAFHREAGAFARASGVGALLALGELSRLAVEAFGAGARHAAGIDELIGWARAQDRPGATLLVKGSRFMRMERVVAALAARPAAQPREGAH